MIQVTESERDYRISVPAGDVDLRRIWVFATPRSIRIETRSRAEVTHRETACKEVDEHRLIRELNLPQFIREGCTKVTPCGNLLEITCLKEPNGDDRNWVEMLPFDTRASFGRI